MNNPTTHTTTTSTTKPTTMEKVKEKASNLADKITGRQQDPNHSNLYHDSNQPGPGFHGTNDTALPNTGNPAATYHAGEQPVDALHTNDRHRDRHHNNQTTMPLHTGAAVGDTAVPYGNTVDRTAYQDKLDNRGVAGVTGPAVPPKDDHTHHHGLLGHKDKGDQHHTAALGGANTTDPNLIHPSVVPHQQTTAGGLQNPGAANVAGPTGTSHVPTYTQNNPLAAGAVPIVGQTAQQGYQSSGGGLMGDHHERHNQAHLQSTMAGPGATTTAAGTQVLPMNTNNSTVPVDQHNMHQTNPVMSSNNAAPGGAVPQSVPAMGAPGTTTAAGTHMPGQYVA